VPLVIEGYGGALSGAIQSGTLKALALSAAERLPELRRPVVIRWKQ